MNDTARRTFQTTIRVELDGAVLETRTHTVTVLRQGDALTALVDGAPATLERAAHLMTWAQDTGSVTLTEKYDPAPIGKARASRLHRILARLGLGAADHYRAASAALGRSVDSLAALTEQEARKVWNHARSLRMAYDLTAA